MAAKKIAGAGEAEQLALVGTGEGAAFEDSVRRLGEIVDLLEAGDLPLEESLKLFEEGVALARSSRAKLDAAEKRVEELLGVSADGKPVVREIDTE